MQNSILTLIFLGAKPISRLKTLKELSDPYPTAEATSDNDVLFARIMAHALYIRHWVRYSRGVCRKMVLNPKAKADLDMLASRASDSTDQFFSRPQRHDRRPEKSSGISKAECLVIGPSIVHGVV